jgi:uncharacterized protein (DUF58 family)
VRRPIAREYEDERDQRLLFLLDCSRRMRHVDSRGRGLLDEALNALLLLSRVAVRQGDAIGLMTYGGVRRRFAPQKEAGTPARLAEAVFDLEAGLDAADPISATADVLQCQPRRAMIVIVTNSRDEDDEDLERAVDMLCRRHLVVVADLRESILDDVADTPVTDVLSAQRFLGVEAYLAERRRRQERLQHLGVRVLDLLPSQLPVALVDQYTEIKRAGLL